MATTAPKPDPIASVMDDDAPIAATTFSNDLDPLMAIDGWKLVRGSGWQEMSPGERALADLFVDLFPSAVQTLRSTLPAPEDIEVLVVLGSDQEALDWGVDEKALGFHAIASHEDEEGFMEINEHHMCVVNVSSSFKELVNDSVFDRASIESCLVTLPHEMMHVAAWIKASGGKTPIEVFDDGGGECAIRQVLKMAEEQAHGRGAEHTAWGRSEDEAESFGSSVVDNWADAQGAGSDAWKRIEELVRSDRSRGHNASARRLRAR